VILQNFVPHQRYGQETARSRCGRAAAYWRNGVADDGGAPALSGRAAAARVAKPGQLEDTKRLVAADAPAEPDVGIQIPPNLADGGVSGVAAGAKDSAA